jgi:hypothetical protein
MASQLLAAETASEASASPDEPGSDLDTKSPRQAKTVASDPSTQLARIDLPPRDAEMAYDHLSNVVSEYLTWISVNDTHPWML